MTPPAKPRTAASRSTSTSKTTGAAQLRRCRNPNMAWAMCRHPTPCICTTRVVLLVIKNSWPGWRPAFFIQGFALTPLANPGFCRGFFSSFAEKKGGIGCADCMPPPPLGSRAFFIQGFALRPVGLPRLLSGLFFHLPLKKMAASAVPILCRHHPSAAASFQGWVGPAGVASSRSLPPGSAELQLGPCELPP